MSKYSIHTIQKFKVDNKKFATLTAYDYTSAKLLDNAGIPLILVGDSASMVMYGYDTTIPETVEESVICFIFLYILAFAIISCLLGSLGLDFITSISGAASAIGNVGPGLGETIGPNGSFQSIPDLGKLLLCFGMILGRLEIFAILVMFSPSFWKN